MHGPQGFGKGTGIGGRGTTQAEAPIHCNTPMHYYRVWGCCLIPNSGTVLFMDHVQDGFQDMGSLTLKIVEADRVIVGILEHSPDHIALAIGRDGQDYYLLECPPWRARQIAASLLNKADKVEGIR